MKNIQAFVKACPEAKLEKYCERIKTGKTFDYTKQGWGHSISYRHHVGNLVQCVTGFYMRILGVKKPSKGDNFLLKTIQGEVKNYLILDIKFERDPEDMFQAYVVCYTD